MGTQPHNPKLSTISAQDQALFASDLLIFLAASPPRFTLNVPRAHQVNYRVSAPTDWRREALCHTPTGGKVFNPDPRKHCPNIFFNFEIGAHDQILHPGRGKRVSPSFKVRRLVFWVDVVRLDLIENERPTAEPSEYHTVHKSLVVG